MLRSQKFGISCILFGATLLGLSARSLGNQSTAPMQQRVIVESPNPMTGGQFGHETCQDAVTLDAYIGAPGEHRVYTLQGQIAQELLYRPDIQDFGKAVSADHGVLMIGAPQSDVVIVYHQGAQTTLVSPDTSGTFGREVLCKDMDGDGVPELFVGDPGSNKVHVYDYPSLSLTETLVNPETNAVGTYGHSLAFVRWDNDPIYELAVSAPGNTSAGVSLAGRVYVIENAWLPGMSNMIGDVEPPAPVVGDNPRFGMNIHGYGRRLIVGEPRLDTSATEAGSIYLFRQAGLIKQFVLPNPVGEDLLGYRALVGDFGWCGISLNAGPNEGLWFGNRHIPIDPQSSHHWAQSASTQYLFGTPRQDIVLGDNSWNGFEGRVVIEVR